METFSSCQEIRDTFPFISSGTYTIMITDGLGQEHIQEVNIVWMFFPNNQNPKYAAKNLATFFLPLPPSYETLSHKWKAISIDVPLDPVSAKVHVDNIIGIIRIIGEIGIIGKIGIVGKIVIIGIIGKIRIMGEIRIVRKIGIIRKIGITVKIGMFGEWEKSEI